MRILRCHIESAGISTTTTTTVLMEESDFRVVKGKKRRNRKHATVNLNDRVYTIKNDLRLTEVYRNMSDAIIRCVQEQLNSNGFKPIISDDGSQLSVDVVCYGLGNFADSYIARYQLASLMALREDLNVPVSNCHVYDPKFTQEESNWLRGNNFTLIEENEEGKRCCDQEKITLIYMPHCGKALYNNLLWANWGEGLHSLIIVGNSFRRMVESCPERILQKTAQYVSLIQPYTQEICLEVGHDLDDVFNDTSIHTFLRKHEQEVPQEFWENSVEPLYDQDDPEIIFR